MTRSRAMASELVDPCSAEDYRLPHGDLLEVKTDDGAVLSALVAGTGPTVVLAHGWTNSRDVWVPVARRLIDRGRRVVLYDQRGHGDSTWGRDGFTLARLAADMRSILGEVDADGAVIVGHSMGGMTIQALSALDPHALRDHGAAAVFVATAAHGLGRVRFNAVASRAVTSPRVERLMRSPRGMRIVRGAVGRDAHAAHLRLTRDLFVATHGRARGDLLLAMFAMDHRVGLREFPLPATVMFGERDRLTPPVLGRTLAAALPRAQIVEIPRVGHMLPLEAPDTVTAAILRAAA